MSGAAGALSGALAGRGAQPAGSGPFGGIVSHTCRDGAGSAVDDAGGEVLWALGDSPKTSRAAEMSAVWRMLGMGQPRFSLPDRTRQRERVTLVSVSRFK
jgi:hypothetical protein